MQGDENFGNHHSGLLSSSKYGELKFLRHGNIGEGVFYMAWVVDSYNERLAMPVGGLNEKSFQSGLSQSMIIGIQAIQVVCLVFFSLS